MTVSTALVSTTIKAARTMSVDEYVIPDQCLPAAKRDSAILHFTDTQTIPTMTVPLQPVRINMRIVQSIGLNEVIVPNSCLSSIMKDAELVLSNGVLMMRATCHAIMAAGVPPVIPSCPSFSSCLVLHQIRLQILESTTMSQESATGTIATKI